MACRLVFLSGFVTTRVQQMTIQVIFASKVFAAKAARKWFSRPMAQQVSLQYVIVRARCIAMDARMLLFRRMQQIQMTLQADVRLEGLRTEVAANVAVLENKWVSKKFSSMVLM